MNIFNVVKEQRCTGCRACQTICPVNAITFITDEEGFETPRINSDCIDCGKCYRKCPSNTVQKDSDTSTGFVVKYHNNKVIRSSASGGAFAGLASFFLDTKNALVIGASLCDDLVVRHIAIENKTDLRRLQNSKYVQSSIGNIYSVVSNALADGKTVFFSGTPCQIAGLYATVPAKETKNLYTADIVCHGVPSPAFLERSIKENF